MSIYNAHMQWKRPKVYAHNECWNMYRYMYIHVISSLTFPLNLLRKLKYCNQIGMLHEKCIIVAVPSCMFDLKTQTHSQLVLDYNRNDIHSFDSGPENHQLICIILHTPTYIIMYNTHVDWGVFELMCIYTIPIQPLYSKEGPSKTYIWGFELSFGVS